MYACSYVQYTPPLVVCQHFFIHLSKKYYHISFFCISDILSHLASIILFSITPLNPYIICTHKNEKQAEALLLCLHSYTPRILFRLFNRILLCRFNRIYSVNSIVFYSVHSTMKFTVTVSSPPKLSCIFFISSSVKLVNLPIFVKLPEYSS